MTSQMCWLLGSFVAARTGAPHAQLAAVGTTGALAASLLSIVTTPLFGALSDRVGRLTVYRGGAIFLLLTATGLPWSGWPIRSTTNYAGWPAGT